MSLVHQGQGQTFRTSEGKNRRQLHAIIGFFDVFIFSTYAICRVVEFRTSEGKNRLQQKVIIVLFEVLIFSTYALCSVLKFRTSEAKYRRQLHVIIYFFVVFIFSTYALCSVVKSSIEELSLGIPAVCPAKCLAHTQRDPEACTGTGRGQFFGSSKEQNHRQQYAIICLFYALIFSACIA